VWFDGLGWVAFEPTPGRGSPTQVAYTGQPAAQDSLVQPDNPGGPVTTTTTAPAGAGVDIAGQPQIPEFETGPADGELVGDTGGGWNWKLTGRIALLIAVLGAYGGGVPLWHWLLRRRRRQNATTPAARVETAWAESVDTLELGYGLSRKPSETRREFANRLRSDLRVPGQAMIGLADLTTVARYHPTGLGAGDSQQADQLSGEIEAAVHSRVPAFKRWQRLVDPRRLLTPSARVVVSSSPTGLTTPPPGGASHLNGPSRQPERVG
jgi:hypothetical protein